MPRFERTLTGSKKMLWVTVITLVVMQVIMSVFTQRFMTFGVSHRAPNERAFVNVFTNLEAPLVQVSPLKMVPPPSPVQMQMAPHVSPARARSHKDPSNQTFIPNILLYPKDHIDAFWGSGHTEIMIAKSKQCAQQGTGACSFVSECKSTTCLESLAAVLFIAGIPGRVDGDAHALFARTRPPISAVWNTEGDDNEDRAVLDRKLFGMRLSYSYEPDIDTSQACDGMLQLREQLLGEEKFILKDNYSELRLRQSRKGIAGFISNCDNRAFRTNYVSNMMKFSPIDHFGHCFHNMNNTDRNRGASSWQSDKIRRIRKYMFALAMENKKADGYISEKIFDAYTAGAIPVYYGTEKIFRYMPRSSMLYVEDFASEETLVQYIHHIEKNASLYASFFEWGLVHVNHTIDKFKCGMHELCKFCDIVRSKSNAL